MSALIAALLLMAPPETVLISAGAEEGRTALTYTVTDPSQAVTMVMGLSTKQSVAGRGARVVTPSIRFEMTATRTGSDPAKLEVVFDAITPLAREGLEKGTLPTYRKAWRELVGAKVRLTVDGRGRQTDVKMTLAPTKKLPSAIAEQLPSLMENLRRLHVPLPKEAVGVGASWTTKEEMAVQGLTVHKTTTWTLKRRTADGLRLTFKTAVTAPKQTYDLGKLPDGVTAELGGVDGLDSGEVSLTDGALLPTKLRGKSRLELVLNGKSKGRDFKLSVESKSTVKLSPTPAKR